MKSPLGYTTLALFISSLDYTLGHASLNDMCIHRHLREAIHDKCGEFALTIGPNVYGVELPKSASQGSAIIGTMYDDRRRWPISAATYTTGLSSPVEHMSPDVARTSTMTGAGPDNVIMASSTSDSLVTTTEETDDDTDGEMTDDDNPKGPYFIGQPQTTIMSKSIMVFSSFTLNAPHESSSSGSFYDATPTDSYLIGDPTSTVMSKSTFTMSGFVVHAPHDETASTTSPPLHLTSPATLRTSISSEERPSGTIASYPARTSSILNNVNDQVGPGINNIPIESIKGEGQDGKKATYPNKHGSALCKKAKGCISITKTGPNKHCIDDLQERIHCLAIQYPDLVFNPLEPIACSPSVDSIYCAFIELVPWQPHDVKNERLFEQMDTEPYKSMLYNEVPIKAIAEGIDWIIQGKAKLCGAALVPVPKAEHLNGPEGKGKVYVLKVDINPDLPEMKKVVRDAQLDRVKA